MLDNKNIVDIQNIAKELKDYTLVKTSHLQSLLDDSDFLDCLKSAGVDNWDGYDLAKEMYYVEE